MFNTTVHTCSCVSELKKDQCKCEGFKILSPTVPTQLKPTEKQHYTQ